MYNIMVVDDEIGIIKIIKRILKSNLQYNIISFTNPLEALEEYKNRSDIDLILIDIMMPQLNGLELVNKIKQLNKAQKIIVMTAFSSIQKERATKQLLVSNYITKPFLSNNYLKDCIENTLQLN